MRISAALRVARSLALAFMLCSWSARSLALDPALDASQYAHTAWRVGEGFARSTITSAAQTADGYLWIGTQSGLLRFDGVRSVQWQPPAGTSMPDDHIRALLVTRDGTLWIGTEQGVASWRGGALVTYPQLNGKFVTGLVEDREGTLWVGAVSVPGNGWLCTIRQGRAACEGEDGRFQAQAVHVYADSAGVLWVAANRDLWRWRPGPPVRHLLPEPVLQSRRAMSEDATGALLISTAVGILKFSDGRFESFALPGKMSQSQALAMLRDRDGALWIGTPGDGLIHVHQGRADRYGRSDGMSSGWVVNLFEDREGNIWAQTTDGTDRFRAVLGRRYSAAQGLPDIYSILVGRDESIWLKASTGLYRLRDDEIHEVLRNMGRSAGSGAGHALFQDRAGRIWMGAGESGFGYLENGRLVAIRDMPTGIVDAMADDEHGNLWIGHRDAGLLRLASDHRIHRVAWVEPFEKGRALYWRMAADPVNGGLWIGRYRRLAHFVDGRVRASYNLAEAKSNARIYDLRVAADGALWVAGEGALMRLKAGRIAALDRADGLPCDEVAATIDDDQGSLWLHTPCGIATVTKADLEAWAASRDGNRAPQPIRATIVVEGSTSMQGLRRVPFGPLAVRSPDGRLWFAERIDGMRVVDPRHLPPDKSAPSVLVEQVVADRKVYGSSQRLRLPPLVRDLQIDYTAPNLSQAEKLVFRYRLEGYDRDWREAGSRRQAIYSDLSPGDYRFRVAASNESGVWPQEAAAFDFSIAPAYWQTWWFRTLCVAVLLASLGMLYRLRVRHLARQFNVTLEARVAERTRIARELHDTLLQSFHGVLLRFQTVRELFPRRPADAMKLLENTIDQAAEAITEGRDAVQGLRASARETNDLAAAIRTLGDEIAAENGGSEILRVEVQGAPRNLHPILRDEIFRIAGETLRNAFRHAEAKRIEVELRYDERHLLLRVRDDGHGIDPTVLSHGGREGHFGMHGMRERASLIGGKLTVWSAPGSGTEIELSVPGSHAYSDSTSPRASQPAEEVHHESTS